jgi:hypothetical protein
MKRILQCIMGEVVSDSGKVFLNDYLELLNVRDTRGFIL